MKLRKNLATLLSVLFCVSAFHARLRLCGSIRGDHRGAGGGRRGSGGRRSGGRSLAPRQEKGAGKAGH